MASRSNPLRPSDQHDQPGGVFVRMNGIIGTMVRRDPPVTGNGGLCVGGTSAPVAEEYG